MIINGAGDLKVTRKKGHLLVLTSVVVFCDFLVLEKIKNPQIMLFAGFLYQMT